MNVILCHGSSARNENRFQTKKFRFNWNFYLTSFEVDSEIEVIHSTGETNIVRYHQFNWLHFENAVICLIEAMSIQSTPWDRNKFKIENCVVYFRWCFSLWNSVKTNFPTIQASINLIALAMSFILNEQRWWLVWNFSAVSQVLKSFRSLRSKHFLYAQIGMLL